MLDIGTAIEALKYGATAKIDAGGDAYTSTVQGSVIRGDAISSYSDLFASQESSDTNQETYVTYGLPPQVRKWSGESSYGDAPEYQVTVVNEEWWVGVEIHERVLRRNQLGKPLIRVQALGEEAKRFYDARALSVILATDASVFPFAYGPKVSAGAYNKPLISATHAKGASTQSNYLNSALTNSTLATSIQNAMALTDFQGQRPIGFSPKTLMVGPAVLMTAIDAVMGALRVVTAGDGATGNPILQFGLGLVAVLHTVPTDFAALVDGRNADDMPVIVQTEKQWEQRDNIDNPADPVRRNEGGRIQISLDSAGECAPWAALRIYRIK